MSGENSNDFEKLTGLLDFQSYRATNPNGNQYMVKFDGDAVGCVCRNNESSGYIDGNFLYVETTKDRVLDDDPENVRGTLKFYKQFRPPGLPSGQSIVGLKKRLVAVKEDAKIPVDMAAFMRFMVTKRDELGDDYMKELFGDECLDCVDGWYE